MSKDSSSDKTQTQLEPPIFERVLRSLILLASTVFIFFLGQFVGVVFVITGSRLFGKDSEQTNFLLTDSIVGQFITATIIGAVTVGLLYGLYTYSRKSLLKNVGLNMRVTKQHIGLSILAYAAYMTVLISLLPVLGELIPQIDINQAQQLGFQSPQGVELVIVFASLVVLPPLVEELLFRGFLYRSLRKYSTRYWAAFATSALFAVAHLEFLGDNPLNWVAAIDTFILSLFLVYVVEKTNSLWPAVFLHAIKNAAAFTFLFVI